MTLLLRVDAPDALATAAELLRAGRLIAIPTETVYGLCVLPDEDGIAALVAAKQRSADKGIQLLIDSLDQVSDLVVLNRPAEILAREFWPGGLTLVLDLRADADVPELLTGGRTTLGLRLPDHTVPRRLARELGPLAASSANVSGQPPATTANHVVSTLGDLVELILDDGPVRGGVASTVVALTGAEPEPVILREGALSSQQIEDALVSRQP